MKVKLLALCALLSVASAMAQQKFSSLPIGYNLDGYSSSLRVYFGTTGNWVEKIYPYQYGKDQKLEVFAGTKLRELASQYVPRAGQEHLLYWYGMDAITEGIGGLLPTYNGKSEPATIAVAPPAGEDISFRFTLRNGKWEVPEEVFGKVKFQFGVGISYYVPGVTDLEVKLYNGTRVSRFSTREKISDLDNPCDFAAITLGLGGGLVIIPNEIVLAKPSWWERAEITLHTPNESVTFLVNRTGRDGKAIKWSETPPRFFVPPQPTITLLKRLGNRTEITVEGSGTVVLEFSDNLREWKESGSRIVLAGATAQRVLYQ